MSKSAEWKDATSYSRGERGTVEPRVWAIDIDGLRVSVHRLIHCEGWFGSCHTMGIDRQPIEADGLEAARVEFCDYLIGRATHWITKLHRAARAARLPPGTDDTGRGT